MADLFLAMRRHRQCLWLLWGLAVAVSASADGIPVAEAESPQFSSTTTGDLETLIGAEVPAPPGGYVSPQEFKNDLRSGKVAWAGRRSVVDGIRIRKNVIYAEPDSEPVKLDLYLPETIQGSAPGIVLIHGGGWIAGKKEDFARDGQSFAAKGYVVISINYRLAPAHRFPAAIHDCKAAVRWLRAHATELQLDTDKIAAVGASAGGHLAMLLGYAQDVPELEGKGEDLDQSSHVQAVVSLYAPCTLYGFPVIKDSTAGRLLYSFLGGPPSEFPEAYRLASPLLHLTPDDPPTLLMHGTIDDVCPVLSSDMLASRLKELKVGYVYDRLPGWPHAFDEAAPLCERFVWLTDRFLQKTMQITRAEEGASE